MSDIEVTIPVLENNDASSDAEIAAWLQSAMGEVPATSFAVEKGGPGSGAQAGHEFEGNQWGTGGGKTASIGGKGGTPVTIPSDCGARDFVPEQTLAQIGRMNVLAASGGVVNKITTPGGKNVVGLELPDSSGGHSVRVYLGNNDTYTVQRVDPTGTVTGQQSDIYSDEVGEAVYQASSWMSNPFGGHPGEMNQ